MSLINLRRETYIALNRRNSCDHKKIPITGTPTATFHHTTVIALVTDLTATKSPAVSNSAGNPLGSEEFAD